MAKSKLHSLAKSLGYKSNKAFYNDYPTREAYEMACGGAHKMSYGKLPRAQNGGPSLVNEMIPVGRNITGDPSLQQFEAPGYNTAVDFMSPIWSGATITPRGNTSVPVDATPSTSYQFQYQDPNIQQRMAQNRGFNTVDQWIASGKDHDTTGKIMAFNKANPAMKKGGSFVENFPYIQTEPQFFSPGFYETYNPNNHSSLQYGGYNSPFNPADSMDARMNMDMTQREATRLRDLQTNRLKAMYLMPSSDVDYAGQAADYGSQALSAEGTFNKARDKYALIKANLDTERVNDPNWTRNRIGAWTQKKMGGGFGEGHPFSTQPTFAQFRSYGRPTMPLPIAQKGGTMMYDADGRPSGTVPSSYTKISNTKIRKKQKGGSAEFNQGPEYFTNKMNEFLGGIRDTALATTEEEINNMHMMPDGTMMPGAYHGAPQAKGGGWIQSATKSIKRRGTKGVCTGSKFGSSSCPPGSRRYNLAKTFKKMAKNRQFGGEGQAEMDPSTLTPEQWQQYIMSEEGQQLVQQMGMTPDQFIQAYPTAQEFIAEQEGADQGMAMQQMGGPNIDPNVMGNIDMYSQAYNQAADNANMLDGLTEFASFIPRAQEGGTGITQKQFQTWLDEYFKTNPQYASNRQGYDGYRQRPSYGGYGYFPANASPYMKFKNVKTYINGLPAGANSPFVSGSSASGIPGGVPQRQGNVPWTVTSSPRLFGRKYKWQYGIPPPKQGTIVGNKLRKLFGPKSQEEPTQSLRQQYTSDNVPVADSVQTAGNVLFSRDQAMRTSPTWEQNVQDPNLIPWLKQTASRLGVSPESLVNSSQSTQMEPTTAPITTFTQLPGQQSPDDYMRELEAYQAGVERRNPSPTRKWFLGKRTYPEGQQKYGGYKQYGGAYFEGDELDLSEEEIQKLKRGGYVIEYI